MNRIILLRSSALVLVLAGCSSFNNNFNTYPSPSIVSSANSLESMSESSLKSAKAEPVFPSGKDKCDTFILPTMPAAPELPMKSIVAAGNNVILIEQIERRHIDELRLFISKTRENQMAAEIQYRVLCGMGDKP